MKFNELGLNDLVLEAIDHMGFENATPIQQFAIPEVIANHDLLACAQTGTPRNEMDSRSFSATLIP